MTAINRETNSLLKGNTINSPESIRAADAASRSGRPGARANLAKAISRRLHQLTRRKGALGSLGRGKGVLSILGTPFTTGEALAGVNSSDPNERWKSLETLLGLPEFSTGRGLSEKEKKMKPVWYDPKTGAGEI
jgi:hypothetical protein